MRRTASVVGVALAVLAAGTAVFVTPSAAQVTTASVSMGDATVVESPSERTRLRLPITLSRPLDRRVVLRVTTRPVTTTEGADHTRLDRKRVQINPGRTTPGAGFVVIEPDDDVESVETFELTIDEVKPVSGAEVTVARAVGTVTILDAGTPDDPAQVHVGDVRAVEGDEGTATRFVTFTLSQPRPTATVVDYDLRALQQGFTDFDFFEPGGNPVGSGRLRIPAGRTTAKVRVSTFTDATAEADESLYVIVRSTKTPDVAPGRLGRVTLLDDDATAPRTGTMWAWGDNRTDQLGLAALRIIEPTTPPELHPVQVLVDPRAGLQDVDHGWIDVDAGQQSTKALQADRALWMIGHAPYGLPAFSLPTKLSWLGDVTRRQIDKDFGRGFDIRSDGALVMMPGPPPPFRFNIDPAFNADWVFVDGGGGGLVAIKADGTMWQWRFHNDPPVQVPGDDWASVSTTSGTTLAIKDDGTLWAWGGNSSGQLGLGDLEPRETPTQVGTDAEWVHVEVGPRDGLAPGAHVIAMKRDGTLWAWGANDRGQLGLGDTVDRLSPVRISDDQWAQFDTEGPHVAAVKADGTLWTWGANEWGQLGLGHTEDRWVPTRVGRDDDWGMVTVGSRHTLAIRR